MQSTGSCALHFRLLKEACIPSLKSIRLIVTEICSGQALGDANADNDKSNPYMSPFQGDTKTEIWALGIVFLLSECVLYLTTKLSFQGTEI
jgi:hypothetical protein